MKIKWFEQLQKFGMIFGIAFVILFTIFGFQSGIFRSSEALHQFLARFGVFADIAFILLQIFQVVVPIVPGAVSLLAGVVIFGPVRGFIYNYIGICIGSFIAFSLTRKYGNGLLDKVATPKLIRRYRSWLDSGHFERLFAAAIFFPMAPDDFLCYLAGVSRISVKKFIFIILAGKPLSILIYSLGLKFALTRIWQMLEPAFR